MGIDGNPFYDVTTRIVNDVLKTEIRVAEDPDGLGLVEIQTHSEGKKEASFTMGLEEAVLLSRALVETVDRLREKE